MYAVEFSPGIFSLFFRGEVYSDCTLLKILSFVLFAFTFLT